MRKITLLIACALSAAVAFNSPIRVNAAEEPAKVDDTKMNKEESKKETADTQKMNKSDRETTRKIRRAVVKDKSLSMYAHNVKIITVDGKVTLKGPVRSEKEKLAIEKAAAQVVSKDNITNEITIKAKKEAKEEKKQEEKKE